MYLQNIITLSQYSEDPTSIEEHSHFAYEIIFIKEGSATLLISNKSYSIKAGTLIFINFLEEHSITITSKTYKRYFVTLSPLETDSLITSSQLLSIFKLRPNHFIHTFSISNKLDIIEDIFKNFLEEYENPHEFSQELIKCYLNQLLIYVFRSCPTQFPLYKNDIKPEIYQIQSYIENHFREDILITDLAEKFYLNVYYLSHLFKSFTTYSPKEYLLLVRLRHAKELLSNSSLPIHEVASLCGFKDPNHFTRIFKSKFHITPLQYRKRL